MIRPGRLQLYNYISRMKCSMTSDSLSNVISSVSGSGYMTARLSWRGVEWRAVGHSAAGAARRVDFFGGGHERVY